MINASYNPFSLLVLKMRWPKNQPPWSVIHSRPISCYVCTFYQMSGLQRKWRFLLQIGQVALSATCNLQGNLLPDLPLFFCHNPTRWRLIRMDWSVSTTFLAKVTWTNENENSVGWGKHEGHYLLEKIG